MFGIVIKVEAGGYLVRLGDGKNQPVFTNEETYGNGKPRKGETRLTSVLLHELGYESCPTGLMACP